MKYDAPNSIEMMEFTLLDQLRVSPNTDNDSGNSWVNLHSSSIRRWGGGRGSAQSEEAEEKIFMSQETGYLDSRR